jgi:O-antigen ligase
VDTVAGLAAPARIAAIAAAGPTAALVLVAFLLGWLKHGSIVAADWLGYAVIAAGLLAAVLLSARARRPSRNAVVALAAIVGLAAWTALSLLWSPAPALARDEALLILLYAACFAVPALTLGSPEARLAAVAAVAAGSVALALTTAWMLRFGSDPVAAYRHGRLYSLPISYGPAEAAFALVGVWPALVLAAHRSSPLLLRAAALGGAVACLCVWLLTQSRSGAVGLLVSSVLAFALSPGRLRLLVPTGLAAAFAAWAFGPLTAPYRSGDGALVDAIRSAGGTALWLPLAAAAAGAAYVLLDRRMSLSPWVHGLAARGALLGLVTGLALGVALFVHANPHPVASFENRWAVFKHEPANPGGFSHLTNPGSNRYDFWRVAVDELTAHPLAGIGARGFGAAYLQHRQSGESPARAHSLLLDMLGETGVVGFVLLAVALGVPLAAAARGTRLGLVPATAALAGGAYWLAHAAVDWTWTFPSVGIPFFLLLGTAVAGNGRPRIAGRRSLVAAAAAAALALLAFGPPWLSTRATARALAHPEAAAGDLRWARRFDPLSTDPYLAAYALATDPSQRIAPLRTAVAKEPRSAALLLLLGKAYLDVGARAAALAVLERAHVLAPTEPTIVNALHKARR